MACRLPFQGHNAETKRWERRLGNASRADETSLAWLAPLGARQAVQVWRYRSAYNRAMT